jgi:hypothetical protein
MEEEIKVGDVVVVKKESLGEGPFFANNGRFKYGYRFIVGRIESSGFGQVGQWLIPVDGGDGINSAISANLCRVLNPRPFNSNEFFVNIEKMNNDLFNELFKSAPKKIEISNDYFAGLDFGIETFTGTNINNKPNKKTLMSNIVEFAKNMTLSGDEKLLRKHLIKDYDGNYTELARTVAIDLEAKELGYKDALALQEKIGVLNNPTVRYLYSPLEVARLLSKYEEKIVEIVKEMDKETNK